MGNIKLFAMFCVLPFLSRTAHPATNLTNVISAVSVLMSTRLIQYQFSHPHSRASTAAVSCTASLLFVLNMRRVVPRTHARTHTHIHTSAVYCVRHCYSDINTNSALLGRMNVAVTYVRLWSVLSVAVVMATCANVAAQNRPTRRHARRPIAQSRRSGTVPRCYGLPTNFDSP
jgi:putative flippase GtrA